MAQEPTPDPSELAALLDRARINELIDRYVASIDDCYVQEESPFDDAWARSIFSDDVVVVFPIAEHIGVDGLAELHRQVMSKWQGTLHFSTNRLIRLEGDTASVRATLLGTHLHRPEDPGEPLFAAHVLEADAVRLERGWRFRRWQLRLVWRIGDPPSGLTPRED